MQIISVVHWLATCRNSPHMRSPRVVKYFIPMLSGFRAISKHFTFSAGASSCIAQTPSFCSGPKIYLYILPLLADLRQRLKSTLPMFYDAVVVWLPSLKLTAWVLNEVTSSHIRLTADYWLSPRLILTLPVFDFVFVCGLTAEAMLYIPGRSFGPDKCAVRVLQLSFIGFPTTWSSEHCPFLCYQKYNLKTNWSTGPSEWI